MRTTLDIDEDVLQVVKDLAAQRRSSAGKVLSQLAREALSPRASAPEVRNRVPLLPAREDARPVTVAAVRDLLDSED